MCRLPSRVARGAAALGTGCPAGWKTPQTPVTRGELKQGKKLPWMSLYWVFSLARSSVMNLTNIVNFIIFLQLIS